MKSICAMEEHCCSRLTTITLEIGVRGLSPLSRKSDSFRDLLQMIGIGDEIEDLLQHRYLLK